MTNEIIPTMIFPNYSIFSLNLIYIYRKLSTEIITIDSIYSMPRPLRCKRFVITKRYECSTIIEKSALPIFFNSEVDEDFRTQFQNICQPFVRKKILSFPLNKHIWMVAFFFIFFHQMKRKIIFYLSASSNIFEKIISNSGTCMANRRWRRL